MLVSIFETIGIAIVILLISYLAIGYLLHLVIFPEKKPDVSKAFKPGQTLYSKTEGFRQTVIKQENGLVHCKLEIEPYADGPPKHAHTSFDEFLEIENGELTVWVDGKTRRIRPGEQLLIPIGLPHKPYNETGETIFMKGTFAFPEKFAFYLAQVYLVVDNVEGFQASSKEIFQMTLFQQNGFDAYAVEGPPVFLQKILGFVIAPLARLLGFKSYYRLDDPFLSKPRKS